MSCLQSIELETRRAVRVYSYIYICHLYNIPNILFYYNISLFRGRARRSVDNSRASRGRKARADDKSLNRRRPLVVVARPTTDTSSVCNPRQKTTPQYYIGLYRITRVITRPRA